MRILWVSNGRRVPTGYGNQTNLFPAMLKKAGHQPTIFAYYGQEGAPSLDSDGIMTLPRWRDQFGNDILDAHMKYSESEIALTFVDPFVLDPAVYGRHNWCAWAPVDSSPMLPPNKEALKAARWIWAMSRFGEAEMKNEGFGDKTFYVPLGVDTSTFRPVDREAARQRFGDAIGANLSGKFVVMMNSANKGLPSRKGFSEGIEAFKLFSDRNLEAVLYIHTDPTAANGEHLPTQIAAVGLDPKKVLYPPEYPYLMGMIPPEFLNDAYNTADVFMQPSHGEGFGLPIVEAQAAGCPVIGTGFSSIPELLASQIFAVAFKKIWVSPGTMQAIPDVEDLMVTLELAKAYIEEPGSNWRADARKFALQYDVNKVLEKYMLPALEKMQADMSTDGNKVAARAEMRKKAREAMNAQV